jgi:hypothetical protein
MACGEATPYTYLGKRRGERRREGSLEQKREKQRREVGGEVDLRREQIEEAQGLPDQQW